jgi:hypothetical protein
MFAGSMSLWTILAVSINLKPHRILYIIIFTCSLETVAWFVESISYLISVSIISIIMKIWLKGFSAFEFEDGIIKSISFGNNVP